LFLEVLEPRYTLSADVDASGLVVPLDALLIANALNAKGEFASTSRLDVTGDGFVTAADFDAVAEVLDGGAADGSGGGSDQIVSLAEEGEGEGSGSGSGGGSASIAIAALDANKAEGNDGAFPEFTFRVTLTGDVSGGFNVTWSTMDITTGSERENDIHPDFLPKVDQVLNFTGTDGEYRDISLSIFGDTVVEINKLFQVNLDGVTNVPVGYTVSINTDSALGTIQNDDAAVVTINDAGTAGEVPEAGLYEYHIFDVDLSAPVEFYGLNSVTVTYTIVDVHTNGEDYSDTRGGTVEFDSSFYGGYYFHREDLRIDVVDDNVAELEFEDYYVRLDSVAATGLPVTLSATEYIGDATIKSNDRALVNIVTYYDAASFADIAHVPEATTSVTITVTLSVPVDVPITVRVQTLNSLQTPAASAGLDYTAIVGAAGDVVIAAGDTSGTVELTLLPDSIVEGDEWFHVAVDQIIDQGRMVELGGDAQRDIQIEEDDNAQLTLDSQEVNEPSIGFTDVVFTLTLSQSVAVPVSVTASTRNGSATSGTNADYLANSANITFNPGVTVRTFSVRVYHDNVSGEGDENFFVDLTNLSAGSASSFVSLGDPNVGEGVIHD
jgi:hypothetical protein